MALIVSDELAAERLVRPQRGQRAPMLKPRPLTLPSRPTLKRCSVIDHVTAKLGRAARPATAAIDQ